MPNENEVPENKKQFMVLAKTMNATDMIKNAVIDEFRREICSKCDFFVDCSLENPPFRSGVIYSGKKEWVVVCSKAKHRLTVNFEVAPVSAGR